MDNTLDANAARHIGVQSQDSSHLSEQVQTNENWVRCRNVDVLVAQYSLFAFIIGGVLTSSLILIGTFGNLKSVTLQRNPRVFTGGRFMRETLTALAVWDTILLLSVVGYYNVGTIWKYFFRHQPKALLYSMMIFHPLSGVSFTAVSLLVAALTVQRMFIVQRPMMPRRLSVRKKTEYNIEQSKLLLSVCWRAAWLDGGAPI